MSNVMTPEELKARKRRNMWLALSIGAFVVLVFFISLSKMQAGTMPLVSP